MSHLDANGVTSPQVPAVVPTEGLVEERIDRLDELVGLYFDDAIADHEVTELEGLLLKEDSNLDRYIDHARLHADLTMMFNPAPQASLAQIVGDLAAGELADS